NGMSSLPVDEATTLVWRRASNPFLWHADPLPAADYRQRAAVDHRELVLLVGCDEHPHTGRSVGLARSIAQPLQQIELVVAREQPGIREQQRPLGAHQRLFDGRQRAP